VQLGQGKGSRIRERSMPKTLDEVLVTLPQEQQGKIEHRAQDLIRRLSLRELRKSLGIPASKRAEPNPCLE